MNVHVYSRTYPAGQEEFEDNKGVIRMNPYIEEEQTMTKRKSTINKTYT